MNNNPSSHQLIPSQSVSDRNKSTQTWMKQSAQRSLTNINVLWLQLHSLHLIHQQNPTVETLHQYQLLYQQYQLELTNCTLLNQCIKSTNDNNNNSPVTASQPSPISPALSTSPLLSASPALSAMSLSYSKSTTLEPIKESDEEQHEIETLTMQHNKNEMDFFLPKTAGNHLKQGTAICIGGSDQKVCMLQKKVKQKEMADPSSYQPRYRERYQCSCNVGRWPSNDRNNGHKNTKSPRPNVKFIKGVTLTERSVFAPNTILTKTWALKNSGHTAWGDNIQLVYYKGSKELILEESYPVVNVQAGEQVEVSAMIKTPTQTGRHCAYFRLNKDGTFFGPRLWVDIIVR